MTVVLKLPPDRSCCPSWKRKTVSARKSRRSPLLQVLDPKAKQFPIKMPDFVGAPEMVAEPSEESGMALWGTGYETARAYVEIEHRRKMIKSFWTERGATQQEVKLAVTEAMRGGFTLHVTMVRENRAYLTSRHVDVPWSNKDLTVKWEHFVSKLEPNSKETWTAVITGPGAKKAVAEMVAALYDESLDAYSPHSWLKRFGVFRQDRSNLQAQFENYALYLQQLLGNWTMDYQPVAISYRHFPNDIVWPFALYRSRRLGSDLSFAQGMQQERGEAQNSLAEGLRDAERDEKGALGEFAKKADSAAAGAERKRPAGVPTNASFPPEPDLSNISARQNLNETVFFFPHLISDAEGEVKLEFTMPEALTKWKFMAFAHDSALRSGYLEDKVVTAKDLMIQPNPPRFVREGDEIEFTVKVSNQSPTKQTGARAGCVQRRPHR